MDIRMGGILQITYRINPKVRHLCSPGPWTKMTGPNATYVLLYLIDIVMHLL